IRGIVLHAVEAAAVGVAEVPAAIERDGRGRPVDEMTLDRRAAILPAAEDERHGPAGPPAGRRHACVGEEALLADAETAVGGRECDQREAGLRGPPPGPGPGPPTPRLLPRAPGGARRRS